jgi:NADH:ubiquinone oxidoreductase subunit 4 (subunit M)
MGTYGFMKIGLPALPAGHALSRRTIAALAVVSIVYGRVPGAVQTDIKKIIAYSSISHLGYVMLGLVSFNLLGIQGAVMQMVSHGLVAGGLFLMVGMIYERCHTRDLAAYGGLAKILPFYGVFFVILTLASVGCPPRAASPASSSRSWLLRLRVAALRAGRHLASCSPSPRSPAWCWARSTCCGSRSACSSAR